MSQSTVGGGVFSPGIRQKVLLLLFAVLLVSLTVSGWIELSAQKQRFMADVQQHGNDISKYLAQSLAYSVIGYDYHTTQLQLDDLVTTDDVVYARVVSSDEKVMAESGTFSQGEHFVLFKRPITLNNQQIGRLELGLSTESSLRQLEKDRASLIKRQSLVVFIILIGEFTALSFIIISPVRRITRAFGDMASVTSGKVIDIPIHSNDEFGQMANQFNLLGQQLNETHRMLESKVELADKRLVSKNRELLKKSNELRTMNKKLRKLSVTDELTGLYNRRHFDQHLDKEVALTKRFNQPASLLLIDLDHFKKVNDTFGHAVGDSVLRAVSRQLQETTRESDVVCRIGGEEFAVLCKKTGKESSLHIAEKIRAALEEMDIALPDQQLRITVSIGIATLPIASGPAHDKEFFACADRALYESKMSGRNCVSHCENLIRNQSRPDATTSA